MKTIIQTDVTICSAHRLLLNYPSKCTNLHGHNWNIRFAIEGENNKSGMLVDFTHIKNCILGRYDHKTILCKDDPLVEVLKKAGEILAVMEKNPTAENLCEEIAKYIEEELFSVCPNKLRLAEIRVEETPGNYAEVK